MAALGFGQIADRPALFFTALNLHAVNAWRRCTCRGILSFSFSSFEGKDNICSSLFQDCLKKNKKKKLINKCLDSHHSNLLNTEVSRQTPGKKEKNWICPVFPVCG